MPFKSETLVWPDQLNTLQSMPKATRAQQKAALNVGDSQLTSFRAIHACFDAQAIEKVRLAAKSDQPFILSFGNAEALSGLKSKIEPEKLQAAVHAALDVILARQLATKDIKNLVEWMIKGNSPETFQESETGKKDKNKDKTNEFPANEPDDLTAQVMELAKTALEEKDRNKTARDGEKQTTARDKLKTLLEKTIAEAIKNADSGKDKKEEKKSKSESQNNPSLFWEWMLGVKFMSQLKSKAKKGELTTNEKNLVLADKFLVKPLGWVFGNFGKLFKKMAIGLWHAVEEAAGHTVKKILAVVLPLLFIVLIVWAVLAFFHFAVISPLHWMEAKVKSGFHWGSSTPEESPVPSPEPVVSNIAPVQKTIAHGVSKKEAEKPAPTMAYQPAVSFQNTSSINPTGTLYDPKILESEIKSLPANCLVKDYPMTPDEGMPGDVAVSRMRDLIDPDKYTMLISGGKQTIKLVSPTNTTLTIDYKSTDIFNVLGDDKSPMNFLWEDVKYIHANEIDIETKNPSVNANGNNNGPLAQPNLAPQFVTSAQVYQCSLVVAGSKYPLTIQCAAAADLEHLVSTMQYFIRSSRLAHDTALGGMPYLHQGLMFNNQCVVEKLWADSPADKAGVKLRDMVWSVEQNTGLPPDRKTLETQLGFLASGPHNLFIVSPADRDKAQVEMNANHSNVFNPKRGKVVLSAP